MEEAIMFLIRANTDITTTEMAEYFAVNRRTIQRDLDTLKEKGIAVRKSSKRYSHLKILDLSGESQSKDP
ncbi:MAG: helix-turn-helix domain-containing protein [Bacillota bacterium]|nr:helix-turn-helix domain-containing protein [Bacillota bacterium]